MLTLTVEHFLRAFQLHCFEWGVPEFCYSDLGSQIVAGSNLINNHLSDFATIKYFSDRGIKPLKFSQFPKGCKELGSLVESCVKLVKRLIFGAIGRNNLCLHDFEYLICEVNCIVNQRPIAFKQRLSSDDESFPAAITPDILLKGYDPVIINLVPHLQSCDEDLDFVAQNSTNCIKTNYSKLVAARSKLNKLYNEEFIPALIHQATNKKARYNPKQHDCLCVGDLVLLKEDNTKPMCYPMGIIKSVTINDLGETTDAMVLKGCSRELVKRHASCIIPLLKKAEYFDRCDSDEPPQPHVSSDIVVKRAIRNQPERLAANKCKKLNAELFNNCLV